MKPRSNGRGVTASQRDFAGAGEPAGFSPMDYVLGMCGLDEAEVIAFHKRLSDLTARESEVLSAIIAGYTTVSISFWFGISPKTVNVHRANIYKKLGVRGAGNLVRLAIASGVQPLRTSGSPR